MSTWINEEEIKLRAAIQHCLDFAAQNGATAAEASIDFDKGFSVTVRQDEVETLEHHRDRCIEVTVYFGQQVGTAAAVDFSLSALKTTVNKACNIARFTHADPYAGLADKKLLAFGYPQLDLYHPWAISVSEGIDLARQCEKAGKTFNKKITNSEGATFSTYESLSVYGNSDGFIGAIPRTHHHLSCSLIASDGHEMERDYDYTVAVDNHEMQTAEYVGVSAAKKAIRRLGARTISSRDCPVIFSPRSGTQFI